MSECELPLAIQSVQRTARKSHRCCECQRLILPGQRYQSDSGIWPDGPARYRMCLRCARVREALIAEMDHGDGLAYGEMLDALQQRTYDRHRWASVYRCAAEAQEQKP